MMADLTKLNQSLKTLGNTEQLIIRNALVHYREEIKKHIKSFELRSQHDPNRSHDLFRESLDTMRQMLKESDQILIQLDCLHLSPNAQVQHKALRSKVSPASFQSDFESSNREIL